MKTPQVQQKQIYYASILGTLPRKRKEQRFEIMVESGHCSIAATEALIKLIAMHNIKNVRGAQVQLWHGSETDFVDSTGEKQTIVMRNLFPSGSAVGLQLNNVTMMAGDGK